MAMIRAGDLRLPLSSDALGQSAIRQSPFSLVISARYALTTAKYGSRGVRYVHLDAGHAAQNICLQATALEMGTVPIGAFDDDRVSATLGLAEDETPIYIMPAGSR